MATDPAGILLSIKPKWAELILAGSKTVELRRVTPKRLKPGMAVVLYETGNGIVGEAECERVERWRTALGRYCRYDGSFDEDGWYAAAGLTRFEAERYWRGFQSASACAIWLHGAVRYPRTIPLPIMRGMVSEGRWLDAPRSFHYLTAYQLAAIRREAGMGGPRCSD